MLHHRIHLDLFIFLILQQPRTSTLFPYTTLFRSVAVRRRSTSRRPRSTAGRTAVHDRRRHAAGVLLPQRSEEHTSELQSLTNLVCRLLLEKKTTLPRCTNSSSQTRNRTTSVSKRW